MHTRQPTDLTQLQPFCWKKWAKIPLKRNWKALSWLLNSGLASYDTFPRECYWILPMQVCPKCSPMSFCSVILKVLKVEIKIRKCPKLRKNLYFLIGKLQISKLLSELFKLLQPISTRGLFCRCLGVYWVVNLENMKANRDHLCL